MTFGEGSILNDGRAVIAPWNGTGLWVSTTFIPGPHLRLPDACLTAGGRVWAVGAVQTGGVQLWSAQTGWLSLPFSGPFGTRLIIRPDDEGCYVGVATSPTAWTMVGISPLGFVGPVRTGVIPNGGGASGMKNWDAAGNPIPCAPLDSTLNGHRVRLAVTAGMATIACAIDLPDQVVLSRGTLGTLQLGSVEWATLRLSANGQWWIGTQFGTAPKMFGGKVPVTVPPLITTTEPPVPPTPTLPAKATIDSFETPITFGGKSRAVARATAGTPEQYRWQYQDASGQWKTAATNPASDLDHHYSSGLSGSFTAPGHYPIRLQTIVHGVVTDTSSSTSRVIVVEPVTVPPIPPEPGPPNPPTPGVGEVVVHLTDMHSERPIEGADAWWQPAPAILKQTDERGYAVLKATMTSGVCVKKPGYFSPGLPQQDYTCKVIAPLVELVLERVPPPPPPVPDIHPAGKIFRDAANAPWRYKGVSGFKLGNLFETGQNIKPFLDAYRGFNVIRVWAYTDWAGTGWARPSSVDAVRDFLQFVAEYSGHLIEYTYVTNDSAEAHDWASGFVQQLYATTPRPRLFNEIRNEPQTHSQTISTKRCKPAFDASGAVYASGNYEHSENAFGGYLVAHTQRDSEWPRRCHDLMEYFDGKGPHNLSEPAHRVPCVADEPAKKEDVEKYYPNKIVNPDDWRAYFGGCALLGAGATFHSESGKWGLPPTAEEAGLAAAALEGLDAFPADAPLGNYSRPSDSSLRTYVVGNYSVRIRPTSDKHPVSGFTRIGASNILWKR